MDYIQKNHDSCTGKAMQFSNLYYRSNLHYIEDNINKLGLLQELINLKLKNSDENRIK